MVDPKEIEHVRESVTKIRQVRKIIADYKESLKEKSVEALQEEIEGKLDNILEQSEESVHADEWRELTSLRLELREKIQIVWSSKAKEEEYERLRNDFLKR